jgi:hypothetical protein
VVTGCEAEPAPLKCDHAKYPPTITRMAAATPIKTFLLPPLPDSRSCVPPKLNDGADPTYAAGSLCVATAGFSNRSAAALDGLSSIFWTCDSRAGAGALAAPPVADMLGAEGLSSCVGSGAPTLGDTGVATAAPYKAGGAGGAEGATGFSAAAGVA